jgi:micrococcal nuclease
MLGDMLRLVASLWCVLIVPHAQAADPLPGPVPADAVRVIDGDTVEVRARIWPGRYVETRVRLRGVDTPETRRPDCEAERAAGRQATAFTEDWLAASAFVHGEAASTGSAAVRVSLHDIDLGSFAGRVVAYIRRGDGADLSQALIEAELATAYGETGRWCVGGDAPSR